MSCAIGHRCSPDLVLLWLWCRLAAVALIRPLAWEPPYATGAALKTKLENESFFFFFYKIWSIFKELLLCLAPMWVSLPMSYFRAVSQFATASWISWVETHLGFKARYFGLISGGWLKSWGVQCGVQNINSSGRNSEFWVSSQGVQGVEFMVRLCLCFSCLPQCGCSSVAWCEGC